MRVRTPMRLAGLAALLASALTTMTATPSQAAAPAQTAQTQTSAAGARVVVEDVQVPVPGQAPLPAYLVRPAGQVAPGSQAGILFLHWLGQIHSDRTEFLPEAVQLAAEGAVSLLPEGTFPYVTSPVGNGRDVAAVKHQLAAFRAALNWLTARPQVSQTRIAVVGHDYGAMYGALLANADHRVHTAVLMTPDANWGHWFVKYWLLFHGDRAARYDALFSSIQPVDHVSRLGGHELFQWAGQDIYLGATVRREFAAAAPQAQVDYYPTADHQLDDTALAARDQFLASELGLSS